MKGKIIIGICMLILLVGCQKPEIPQSANPNYDFEGNFTETKIYYDWVINDENTSICDYDMIIISNNNNSYNCTDTSVYAIVDCFNKSYIDIKSEVINYLEFNEYNNIYFWNIEDRRYNEKYNCITLLTISKQNFMELRNIIESKNRSLIMWAYYAWIPSNYILCEEIPEYAEEMVK